MKNQYFGDVGDYGKYSLLRAFAQEGIRVGVNWYLTENDGSSDGKHVRYLENEAEACYDPELFVCLKEMVNDNQRDVVLFEEKEMIPGAEYYHEMLDISGFESAEEKRAERRRWHAEAMAALRMSELVFLDPDNGLRVDVISGRKDSVKYVYAVEAIDYYLQGKNLLYYCHKGRRNAEQWEATKMALSTCLPDAVLIALTFHRGTQRTFIFAIHKDDLEQYEKVIIRFMNSEWKKWFEIEPVNGTYLGRGTAFAGPTIGTIVPRDYVMINNPDGTIAFVPPEK